MKAKVGDKIVVTGHAVGDPQRVGEILEILGGERPHYRVRWEDGHESIVSPSSDATIRPRERAAR
jgi:hypothetical protein